MIPIPCPGVFVGLGGRHSRASSSAAKGPSLCGSDHGGCRLKACEQVSSFPAHVEFPAAAFVLCGAMNDCEHCDCRAHKTVRWLKKMRTDDSGGAAVFFQMIHGQFCAIRWVEAELAPAGRILGLVPGTGLRQTIAPWHSNLLGQFGARIRLLVTAWRR